MQDTRPQVFDTTEPPVKGRKKFTVWLTADQYQALEALQEATERTGQYLIGNLPLLLRLLDQQADSTPSVDAILTAYLTDGKEQAND